jgi:hypothetical protein
MVNAARGHDGHHLYGHVVHEREDCLEGHVWRHADRRHLQHGSAGRGLFASACSQYEALTELIEHDDGVQQYLEQQLAE